MISSDITALLVFYWLISPTCSTLTHTQEAANCCGTSKGNQAGVPLCCLVNHLAPPSGPLDPRECFSLRLADTEVLSGAPMWTGQTAG